jgi:hypothetical protein
MHVGACGHVQLCQEVNVTTSRDPSIGKAYPILKAPRWSDWMPKPVPGRGGRQVGQIGGEILSVHDYRNEGKRWRRLLPSSVLFRLVTSPLQQGVVESYPVRGVWFPSRLLLEGTDHI